MKFGVLAVCRARLHADLPGRNSGGSSRENWQASEAHVVITESYQLHSSPQSVFHEPLFRALGSALWFDGQNFNLAHPEIGGGMATV